MESFNNSFRGMEAAKRICLPSGLHFGDAAPYLNRVNCMGSPPSNDKRNNCGLVFTDLTESSCFPSGLHIGCEAFSFMVSGLGAADPSVGTRKIWLRYFYSHFWSPSGSMPVTTKTAF